MNDFEIKDPWYFLQFKADYSGVKSKSELHIVMSHIEGKKMPKFSKMKLFVSAIGRFREFFKIFFVDLNRSNF